MQNVSSLKPKSINTPKTPGGISKSLLTPCRRLGLSRNWKKGGPSPFISPLSGTSGDVKEEKRETRKRKQRVPDENIVEADDTANDNEVKSENIDTTPTRNVEAPCKKKSKTLISTIKKSQEDISSNAEVISENVSKEETVKEPQSIDSRSHENEELVSTPIRTKSKKIKKHTSPSKTGLKNIKTDAKPKFDDIESTPSIEQINNNETVYKIKEKSPNDLRKECIVVIQRKIFKNVIESNNEGTNTPIAESSNDKLQDSDSDDTPLIIIHKQNSIESKTIAVIEDDDDFIDNKASKLKPDKLKDTKSPKTKLKTSKSKTKVEKVFVEQKPSNQKCFDDDNDDDFDNKKTIIIRKTYDKVIKPIKAKSTGSITQRDIDNLRDRIEAKKKLLLAQSLTPDTLELRTLIKKWQKGCQDALMELLDLMRNKFPDKERMDYSEMLKTLKIPPSLVGYDSENDCFISPDDASIILGEFKDS